MSRNEIIEALHIVEQSHAGETYPANDRELEAVVDMVWADVLRRTVDREFVRREVVAFFERDKYDSNIPTLMSKVRERLPAFIKSDTMEDGKHGN
jgi:enoyl reductase-like protein